MDIELWVTVAAAASINQTNVSYSRPNSSTFSRTQRAGPGVGLCYAFNRSGGCRFVNCKFAHKCSVCFRIGHSAIGCRSGNHGNRPSASFAGDRTHTGRRNNGATAGRVPASQHGGQRQHVGLGTSPAVTAARAKDTIQGKPGNFRPSNTN